MITYCTAVQYGEMITYCTAVQYGEHLPRPPPPRSAHIPALGWLSGECCTQWSKSADLQDLPDVDHCESSLKSEQVSSQIIHAFYFSLSKRYSLN